MEETSLLSEAETARYRDQGYLALPDMCPQDEVGYILRTLLELFANKTGYNDGAQYDFISRDDPSKPAKFPSLYDPAPLCPGLAEDRLSRAHAGAGAPAAGRGRRAVRRTCAAQTGAGRVRDAVAPRFARPTSSITS